MLGLICLGASGQSGLMEEAGSDKQSSNSNNEVEEEAVMEDRKEKGLIFF